MFFFLLLDVSGSLSRSIAPCLYSLAPHNTNLTIDPLSINHTIDTHTLLTLLLLPYRYQLSLWDGGVVLPNSDGHARERFRAHFFGGGSVAVMPMRLRSLFAQDSYGTTEDGLLSEFFFDSLSSLLGLSTSMGSPVNNQEYLVDTLVLVSPLPLIHDDPALVEGTCSVILLFFLLFLFVMSLSLPIDLLLLVCILLYFMTRV